MKKLIIPVMILIAMFSAFVVNETILSKANADPLPNFNIRVMQNGGISPQVDAQVLYIVGGSVIYDGRTNSNGWCYTTLATAM